MKYYGKYYGPFGQWVCNDYRDPNKGASKYKLPPNNYIPAVYVFFDQDERYLRHSQNQATIVKYNNIVTYVGSSVSFLPFIKQCRLGPDGQPVDILKVVSNIYLDGKFQRAMLDPLLQNPDPLSRWEYIKNDILDALHHAWFPIEDPYHHDDGELSVIDKLKGLWHHDSKKKK
ncbi:hypothetical protein DFA_02860 [Cavenderia fasciculata]|uniref:Uncharacterized protein n=1 Tax=Cavenderia fasciculata TaxID=261658 RepID=F4PIN7_CACFS|nr:uncharacterized protein DFA_02860 [Cavenderia fasciculata]EGG24617.1 hypothetical protein DFA_02860 [Cavenderia fasciculata]|eukprot:XP_004362468.1 hypothetical protein DFA_02860 [Cavenderia fasciculata]